MKIISIVGARPQFIKASVLFQELQKQYESILVHTGQHYDYEMSKLFFDQLGIPTPTYNLGVGSGTQAEQTGHMLSETEKVLQKEQPDFVLVYGDTNSTLAGTLAAIKLHIPVGHVEAGLRSFDKTMPEEINRILTDHSSELLFAPTQTAVQNLQKEGITRGVYLTGDVMYDVLLNNRKYAENTTILTTLNIKAHKYILATLHRQSNTDNPENLLHILTALSQLEETVVFPVHPRTEKCIRNHRLKRALGKNILLIKPVGYFEFLWLENNAKKIVTDSGGIQKEAYIFKIPCITTRENTEWVETVDDGWNILVGSDVEKIKNAVRTFQPSRPQRNVFGDGHASEKIIGCLHQYLQESL